MEFFLCVLAYLVVGLVFDVFAHKTYPVVYWDAKEALLTHAVLIVVWPYALVSLITHR